MAQGQGSAELAVPLAVPLAVSPGRMVSGRDGPCRGRVGAAAFRAAGFGAELLVSGGLEHMVNAASASGDGGREIHEGCSCDSPALLPVSFSCQSQCRRSSGDNVAVVVVPLSIPSVQEVWCKWGFSAATVRLGRISLSPPCQLQQLPGITPWIFSPSAEPSPLLCVRVCSGMLLPALCL